MKKRASRSSRHGPEFKGVVKKITGRLTNRPELVEEGRAEMGEAKARPRRGTGRSRASASKSQFRPDPYRRG